MSTTLKLDEESVLSSAEPTAAPDELPRARCDRRVAALPLAGVVLVAVALRVWGIGFGLPHVYHYDEHFYINTALKVGAGVLNNPPFAATGLSDLLVILFGADFVVARVLRV